MKPTTSTICCLVDTHYVKPYANLCEQMGVSFFQGTLFSKDTKRTNHHVGGPNNRDEPICNMTKTKLSKGFPSESLEPSPAVWVQHRWFGNHLLKSLATGARPAWNGTWNDPKNKPSLFGNPQVHSIIPNLSHSQDEYTSFTFLWPEKKDGGI